MTQPGTPSQMRRWLVPGLALVLFLLVFVLRFAPLGGAFGGFDNDHFLHFSYAKQVEAGEQPLRDFLDAGLQGARPSLTYELSAGAQRLLGDNLRSEALLTVTGVALSAAVTFGAAASLAPWPVALLTAVLAALASPKLYSYPKVLVLSAIALLIVGYAKRPSRWRLAALGAWTAVAFLFRHDYAVYCGIGIAVLLVAVHWQERRRAVRRVMAVALLAGLLLSPSLWWIQQYAGLVEYVRNGLDMSRRESGRTRLNTWPSPVWADLGSLAAVGTGAFYEREEDTEAWLYYAFLALPLVALFCAARWPAPDEAWQRSAAMALAVMSLVVWRTFLRGNLEARFGEMAPLIAVLGAWLLAGAFSRGRGPVALFVVRAAAAAVVLAVTAACVWAQQDISSELRTIKASEGPAAVAERVSRISDELRTLPAALRGSPGVYMETAGYIHACTRPADRVFLMTYAPEVAVFSDRLFAGGRSTFIPGFYADVRYSQQAIAHLERESVPIALVEPYEKSELYQRFPPVADYLRTHYDDVGAIGLWRVLVQRGRQATGTSPAGLPCFN